MLLDSSRPLRIMDNRPTTKPAVPDNYGILWGSKHAVQFESNRNSTLDVEMMAEWAEEDEADTLKRLDKSSRRQLNHLLWMSTAGIRWWMNTWSLWWPRRDSRSDPVEMLWQAFEDENDIDWAWVSLQFFAPEQVFCCPRMTRRHCSPHRIRTGQ